MGRGTLIREFRPDDAEAAAALIHELLPQHVVTAARVAYRGGDGRSQSRGWLGLEDGEVVGWAEARLRWGGSVEGVGSFWIGVRRDRRRQGLGRALFERAEARLRELGVRTMRSYAVEDAGRDFLDRRGFRRDHAVTFSRLDPRTVDERPTLPEGFRLATVADLAGRTRDLFDLYAVTEHDMPGDHALAEDEFDEWVAEILEHPDFAHDGSYVVLDTDERAVSLAFLIVDLERGRAENEMTGTLRELRGLGLAKAAKLATIAWAARNGVSEILTANDDENAPMLGLNRRLGYRRFLTSVDFSRDE